MSNHQQKLYPSEFKESAIKLALESEKPMSKTASDLGIRRRSYLIKTTTAYSHIVVFTYLCICD